jgi:hypothetical protein
MFVFWYYSPNVLDTLHTCNISWLRVKEISNFCMVKFILDRRLMGIDRKLKKICKKPEELLKHYRLTYLNLDVWDVV